MSVIRSAIEWTDSTWSPVTGCDKVSPGCDNCYAETIAKRFAGSHAFPDGFAVTLHPDRLEAPLHWRKPRRVFVNSMSDLFHDAIPDHFIESVFIVMAHAPQHTFQILTKRPGRMRSWIRRYQPDPLPNCWLGVSAEDQRWADIRIPILLDTPAAVRFVSAEPLLGPIDLLQSATKWVPPICDPRWKPEPVRKGSGQVVSRIPVGDVLHWVIAGGESGPHHRPMDLDWVRSIRDQCVEHRVAFLFKQVGGRTPKAGGRMLDGRTWDEYPA